jgi:hypothetical protein
MLLTWINDELPFISLNQIPVSMSHRSSRLIDHCDRGGLAAGMRSPSQTSAATGVAIATALMPRFALLVWVGAQNWPVASGAGLLLLLMRLRLLLRRLGFFGQSFSKVQRFADAKVPASFGFLGSVIVL